MKLLSARQMQALDQQAIHEGGIPGVRLMEQAGLALVTAIEDQFSERAPGPLLILAGSGNNGGDGYVVARHLLQQGWRVRTLVLASRDRIGGDARVNLDQLLAMEADVRFCPEEADLSAALASMEPPALLLDALLGTGLTSDVRGGYAEAIRWLNSQSAPVVAVDIPSGVHATSGRIMGLAVQADLTVTFAAHKPGLWSCPGAERAGRVLLADIGIPERFVQGAGEKFWLTDAACVRPLLRQRAMTAHKGTAGHLLVAAGSLGKTGAAVLAAEAGLRAGAGLVTLACPECCWDPVASRLTEVMTEGLPSGDRSFLASASSPLLRLCDGKAAVAFGPGLGQEDGIRELTARMITQLETPLVIDADGLNALSGQTDLLQDRKSASLVLTPHPGEMARLTGLEVAEVQADRLEVARAFARCHGLVLVLKGARTLVAAPDGRVWINGSGNPALATAGTGDVLSGLIGGLLAQGMSPEDAAVVGVYLHGMAADSLAVRLGDCGMMASDLLTELPRVRTRLLRDSD